MAKEMRTYAKFRDAEGAEKTVSVKLLNENIDFDDLKTAWNTLTQYTNAKLISIGLVISEVVNEGYGTIDTYMAADFVHRLKFKTQAGDNVAVSLPSIALASLKTDEETPNEQYKSAVASFLQILGWQNIVYIGYDFYRRKKELPEKRTINT